MNTFRLDHNRQNLKQELLEHPERFCNIKTAAAALQKSPSTIKRLLNEGRIMHCRIGRTVWIYKPALLDLIE